MKKIFSLVLSTALLVGSLIPHVSVSAASTYNYGEALQKSFYFYEAQQAGPLPDWNRVEWRGDATMNDAVLGGWYDAGDHVKFNLPMSYTASTLGWSLYEYPEGYEKIGQLEIAKNNLKFALDYLAACDKGNSVVYQIGDGDADHKWWGPVEVIEKEMTRPSFTCNASCVTGQMAAALAIGSIVLEDDTYLQHAESLFKLADSVRSDSSYVKAKGFYDSWSGFWDELMWASVWLYLATDDQSYLDKAESYVDKLEREGQGTTEIKYSWGHCWDDSHYGAMLLLARITGKQEYHDFVEKHLNWWTVGTGEKKIKYTAGGLAWLDSWGPLRYAVTAGFLASVYADCIEDETLIDRYETFAKSQIDYCLGSNPAKRSYVCGFGVNPPVHPHHRTAQGSWADQSVIPEYHRHVLYGALVGGPSLDEKYVDSVKDFTANEVATDYNAGYTALLAKMCSVYGGTPLANFPEPAERDDEFFVEASINSSGNSYTEIKALLNNRSTWPARFVEDLSFNYYFDASEVIEAGADISEITATLGNTEFPAVISDITQYDGNIYYVKLKFEDSTNVCPIGQDQYAGEIQFRIAAPHTATYWDSSNDYSYEGLKSANNTIKTDKITVYDGDRLIYGTEPDGTTPQEVLTTPAPTPTPTKITVIGDADLNGSANALDFALMRKQLLGMMQFTEEQLDAADVDGNGTFNALDFALMRKYLLGMVKF